MKIFTVGFPLLIFFLISEYLKAQINPSCAYPELFDTIQLSEMFPDQKAFVDYIPLLHPDTINIHYNKEKSNVNFELNEFVNRYFKQPRRDTSIIFKHIKYINAFLKRKPCEQDSLSSLIALPNEYIVPGGRFREVYYWDTYFAMLGLQVFNEIDLIESQVSNFAFLIDEFGFIPNGNRTYYLSRSQPPFFSLMVDILADLRGDSAYITYLPQMQKEYKYWMQGKEMIQTNYNAHKKLVRLHQEVFLNRFYDGTALPRPESYRQDVSLFKESQADSIIFMHIRSAAESGWDFSSRWLKNSCSLATIYTADIVPVDLNCLLFHLEETLYKAYALVGEKQNVNRMEKVLKKRKDAIIKYCWNKEKEYFLDYNFTTKKSSMVSTLAALYPLFFSIANDEQAKSVLSKIEEDFLKEGGLVTSLFDTGQQWDYPNGWAPLQWIGYVACKNYGYIDLANEIAKRWTNLNLKVYFETGKMLEKYNVVDVNIPGGGGEYDLQDGFGWTNGVFIKLWFEDRDRKYIEPYL
jgi:alpha,alpha-trehalase